MKQTEADTGSSITTNSKAFKPYSEVKNDFNVTASQSNIWAITTKYLILKVKEMKSTSQERLYQLMDIPS